MRRRQPEAGDQEAGSCSKAGVILHISDSRPERWKGLREAKERPPQRGGRSWWSRHGPPSSSRQVTEIDHRRVTRRRIIQPVVSARVNFRFSSKKKRRFSGRFGSGSMHEIRTTPLCTMPSIPRARTAGAQ